MKTMKDVTRETKTININVAAAQTGSIAFMGATNQVLAIKGAGGQTLTENSELTFKLLDINGNPVGQKQIDFALSQNPGGALLDSAFQFTNNEGLVTVSLRKSIFFFNFISSYFINIINIFSYESAVLLNIQKSVPST